MKTTEYLDEVKRELTLPSDYALAKKLGVVTSSIIAYRNGRSAMGIEICLKVGEILRIDGHTIYADGQLERAKTPDVRQFWHAVSEKFSASFKALLSETGPYSVRLALCR